jgi:hypothetical protein
MKSKLYILILALVFVFALLLASASFLFGYVVHLKAMWEWESGLHKHAIAQWSLGAVAVVGICGCAYCLVRDTFKALAVGIFR